MDEKNIKKLFKAVAKGREGFDKLNHSLNPALRTGRVTVDGFSKATAKYLLGLFGGTIASKIDRAVAIGGSVEFTFKDDAIRVNARDAKGGVLYWCQIPRYDVQLPLTLTDLCSTHRTCSAEVGFTVTRRNVDDVEHERDQSIDRDYQNVWTPGSADKLIPDSQPPREVLSLKR